MSKEINPKIVNEGRIIWQHHALKRMLERDIGRKDVKKVLIEGEILESYPDDHPLPSFLIFGRDSNKNPLHVVAALDMLADWCYIITVYRPNKSHFKDDFKTRIK
tara:strand:- start:62 stop:376 length:315 start_codon:yes stop_codon:yes gene_type:complete